MSAEPPPLPPPARKAWPALLLGMLVANAVGGGLFAGVAYLLGVLKGRDEGLLVVPNLFLIPLLIGLVAAWFWRRLELRIAETALHSLVTSLIGLAAAAIILREGVVCILMVFPGLYLMVWAGTLLGRIWFRPRDTTLKLSIVPLIALAVIADASIPPRESTVVVDQIVIDAPPRDVWPHVLAFGEIPDPANDWVFRIGLPHPTQTTNGGNFVGADRQCTFSDGIVINERVAEFVPERRLTFDIVEQPTHPEAYGHITLHRGRFELTDNGDGTTTLIGSSWYTLHVRPRWYFDLWTRHMTRAVHRRVMEHVRNVAEAEAQRR